MTPGTIEVKYAFVNETQREELEADIAAAVLPFGYEIVEGVQSTIPGVKELVFLKANLKNTKPEAKDGTPKKKKTAKKKKVAKKKIAKKKVAKKKKK